MKISQLAISVIAGSALLLSGCDSTSVTRGLSDLGIPIPNQAEETSVGTKLLAGVSGCAVGGAIGFFSTQYISRKLKEKGYNYTSEEIKQASAIVGGLGCVIGGKTALSIIKNMDEEAKRAQQSAWQLAQQQSQTQATRSPQPWKSGDFEGEVEIVQVVTTDEGRECATRRNFIKTPDGEAEQYIPVCKNSSGFYEQVPV